MSLLLAERGACRDLCAAQQPQHCEKSRPTPLHAPRAQSVVCPPLHVRRETAGVLPERGLTELGRLAERLKGSVSLPSVTFSAFASLKLSMLDNRA